MPVELSEKSFLYSELVFFLFEHKEVAFVDSLIKSLYIQCARFLQSKLLLLVLCDALPYSPIIIVMVQIIP